MKLATDVSIVVMTYERPDFVRRMVGALEHLEFGGCLIISDASSEGMFRLTDSYLAELGPSYEIKHLPSPKAPGLSISASMHQSLALGVQRMETPFGMLTCDDDLPVPHTLGLCAEMLRSKPELGAAFGDFTNVDFTNGFNRSENPDVLKRKRIDLQGNAALNGTTAAKRYLEFIENFFHTMFVVSRKEILLKATPGVGYKITFPHFSADYLWMFTLAITGPSIHVNAPHIVRQRHTENLNLKNPFPSYLQALMSDTWTHDANSFVNYIGQLIADVDGIPIQDARAVATDGFGKLTAFRLLGQLNLKNHSFFKSRVKRYSTTRSTERSVYDAAVEALLKFNISPEPVYDRL